MNTRALWIIVGLIIIIGAGWYLWGNGASAPTEQTPGTSSAAPSANMPVNPQSQNVVVKYTNQGFEPSSVSIPVGATVIFTNETGSGLWVASQAHPAHTLYDGTSREEHCAAGYAGPTPFDSCRSIANGESYSFTFGNTGTWKYHNHVAAEDTGTVVVTAPVETEVNVNGSGSVGI